MNKSNALIVFFLSTFLAFVWFISRSISSTALTTIIPWISSVIAILAVFGDTVDKTKDGLGRVTTIGKIVIFLLVTSLIVSANKEYNAYNENKEKEETIAQQKEKLDKKEEEQKKRDAFISESNRLHLSRTVLKLVMPLKLIGDNTDYSETIVSQHNNDAFLDKAHNLDLFSKPKPKNKIYNILDVSFRNINLDQEWWRFIQENVFIGIDGLDSSAVPVMALTREI